MTDQLSASPRDSGHLSQNAAGPGAGSRLPRIRVAGRDITLEVGLAALLVAFIAIAGATTDAFLTEANVTNLLKQMVTTGLLAYGMLTVILTVDEPQGVAGLGGQPVL
ncbi:hypothetical protein ACFWFE_27820, partial [Streptomyces sp. NPDC060210]